MADETDLRDPDLLVKLVSSEGDSEGSESEDSEGEPERTAADHGYNLRPKRMVTGTVAAPERNKRDAIAPGEGVVAPTIAVSAGATSGSRVDPAE